MARLIDADALIKSTDKESVHMWQIALAPTVDAVKVIRCRDCRFFEDEDEYGNCYCEEWGNITNANGYCHDAERRKKDEIG